ncbi:Kef-type K+ transport system membrane component KefB [Mycolicibacterium sp. BK556]|uniref:cation:proton antiporter n=1 Tax=unclassified Mycolicibacterium TaxID=2636767 RepID=UPI00161B3641|nr:MULTISPECIES: cation:proton antiporter [unclassified Mycolicibacterium]MBB3600513.1 Kef-type K+ transport system membrane component KefB [Mycolicibacterium sp. BK556]MBB3630266.1 Kef-type K+ transport system membrane component KefB [Mycolicibacterium sp. BK607]MBB3748266.1 Kef-type K+ transport system membrane component KefB [Mycolicibacterium sp. BK634]
MPLGAALQGLTVLAVIVIGSVIIGSLFSRIGQPRVLGPIVVGILVGTALAACPEPVRSELVSTTSRQLLDAVGTAGLLLLMFSAGNELKRFGTLGDASLGWRVAPCVVIPIAVSALAAWPFAARIGGPEHHDVYGWLFVGVALGITAVPVLVLIVKDLGIGLLSVAQVALRVAVVTDGFAWILVTGLVVISHATAMSARTVAIGAALLVMVVLVVPRVIVRIEWLNRGAAAWAMMAVSALAGAAATQLLGFHPAIGAVIAGFTFPAALTDASSGRTFNSVVNVLWPAFFVSIAMSVPLQALHEVVSWGGLACVAILATVAVASKLLAGMIFGMMSRWPWRTSAKLGVLLNCRGVTEIAIASVGFQARLISPFAFAMLCGLAIATTAATAPLYRALGMEASETRETTEVAEAA